jgi:hypothetical protein
MACSGNEEMKPSYSKHALDAKKPLFFQIMLKCPFSKKVAKDHNLKKKWPKIIITLLFSLALYPHNVKKFVLIVSYLYIIYMWV